jgi:hypothetical protein
VAAKPDRPDSAAANDALILQGEATIKNLHTGNVFTAVAA